MYYYNLVRHQKVEGEPDVDHFHIGRGGKAVKDADKERGQHQQQSHVDCDGRLKEERLEVAKADDAVQDRRDIL